jgi:NADH-quinone oxidoreductase subunit L
MCRVNPILHAAPDAAHVVAWVGGATAFIGATSACAQQDIKKILAYSTVSQLGFMFMAAGVGAYVAAIFLMLTHAFYKALLFLGAGSVIHAMDDEQDVKKMGGLAKVMPLTAATFFIAWLSIAGVPSFSGFWSKGDVVQNSWALSPGLWALGVISALLTAYYMGREYSLVFLGKARWEKGGEASSKEKSPHPHDPRLIMKLPLVVLAIAAALGGFINLPFHPNFVFLERWLAPVVGASLLNHNFSVADEWLFAIVDAIIAITGVVVAWSLWKSRYDRENLEPGFLQRAWGLDNAIDKVFAGTSDKLAGFFTMSIDTGIIDATVNLIGKFANGSGRLLRKAQTGYVRMYAMFFAAASIALLAYLMTRVAS